MTHQPTFLETAFFTVLLSLIAAPAVAIFSYLVVNTSIAPGLGLLTGFVATTALIFFMKHRAHKQ